MPGSPVRSRTSCICQNMLQNTARLPAHVWGQVQSDLNRLQSVVTKAQGISFSWATSTTMLSASFRVLVKPRRANRPRQNFSTRQPGRLVGDQPPTIGGTLEAQSTTQSSSRPKGATYAATLDVRRKDADGQMQAPVGDSPPNGQQMQKHGTNAQQMTMMELSVPVRRASRDLAQARRELLRFTASLDLERRSRPSEPRW